MPKYQVKVTRTVVDLYEYEAESKDDAEESWSMHEPVDRPMDDVFEVEAEEISAFEYQDGEEKS